MAQQCIHWLSTTGISCLTQVSYIVTGSVLYQCCISVVSVLYQCCISVVSVLYQCCISVVSILLCMLIKAEHDVHDVVSV